MAQEVFDVAVYHIFDAFDVYINLLQRNMSQLYFIAQKPLYQFEVLWLHF